MSIQIKSLSTIISRFPAKVSAIYFPGSIIFRLLKVEKTEIVAWPHSSTSSVGVKYLILNILVSIFLTKAVSECFSSAAIFFLNLPRLTPYEC